MVIKAFNYLEHSLIYVKYSNGIFFLNGHWLVQDLVSGGDDTCPLQDAKGNTISWTRLHIIVWSNIQFSFKLFTSSTTVLQYPELCMNICKETKITSTNQPYELQTIHPTDMYLNRNVEFECLQNPEYSGKIGFSPLRISVNRSALFLIIIIIVIIYRQLY